MKVCHLTSAHQSNDDRIFLKECRSLAKEGYEVYLVAQGSNRIESGVSVVGVGRAPSARLKRMTSFAKSIYIKALALDCDIYHFHDPELLPYGLKLKRKGKKVIFDSHEDVSAQIQDKEWIPSFLRSIIAYFYRHYETYVTKQIDAVVAATPHIAETFINRSKKVVVINNYPLLDDIHFHDKPFEERDNIVCYAGGISTIRGMDIMIEATRDIDVSLVLAGPCEQLERLKNLMEKGENRI